MRDGVRSVTVRGLHRGTKPVVVRFLGWGLVDAGSVRSTVEILRGTLRPALSCRSRRRSRPLPP